MVDLYVGAEKKHFCVHKDLLRNKSKAFEAMFSPSFKEGQDSKAHFPKEDPAVFALLIQCLYTGQVPGVDLTEYKKALGYRRLKADSLEPKPKELITAIDNVRAALHLRVCLFILADMYHVTDVLDTTMNCIWAGYKCISSLPTIEEISFVYGETVEGSLLRKYMAHCCYWQALKGMPKDMDDFVDSYRTSRLDSRLHVSHSLG